MQRVRSDDSWCRGEPLCHHGYGAGSGTRPLPPHLAELACQVCMRQQLTQPPYIHTSSMHAICMIRQYQIMSENTIFCIAAGQVASTVCQLGHLPARRPPSASAPTRPGQVCQSFPIFSRATVRTVATGSTTVAIGITSATPSWQWPLQTRRKTRASGSVKSMVPSYPG
jgi:hypothetical protein